MVMALLFKLSFPRKRKPGYVSRHRLATLRILDLISEKGHRTTERENFPFLLSPSSGRFSTFFRLNSQAPRHHLKVRTEKTLHFIGRVL